MFCFRRNIPFVPPPQKARQRTAFLYPRRCEICRQYSLIQSARRQKYCTYGGAFRRHKAVGGVGYPDRPAKVRSGCRYTVRRFSETVHSRWRRGLHPHVAKRCYHDDVRHLSLSAAHYINTFTGYIFDRLKGIPDDGKTNIELKLDNISVTIKEIKDHQVIPAEIKRIDYSTEKETQK